ncbi:serine dehydratase alpha chain-domain-containing protein [Gorgonomyces haynaldii]|nr:serine dehydratase alpha chain-domain-containing protein [Gorgonomyces haynaldii]
MRILRKYSQNIQHAVVSVFDLFSIGIGPSSSHTVGPMRAAKIFVEDLVQLKLLDRAHQLRVDLYGSLALTGVGHGTPNAILLGLEGEKPESVDTTQIEGRIEGIYKNKEITVNSLKKIQFIPEKNLVFHFRETLPQHPNGMRISAFDDQGDLIASNEYFSIGGGFVLNDQLKVNVFFKDKRIDHVEQVSTTPSAKKEASLMNQDLNVPSKSSKANEITAALPFHDAESLLQICSKEKHSIAQVVFQNELQWRNAEEITTRTLNIWNVMNQSIINGITSTQEYLPGKLKVKRRAPGLFKNLQQSYHDFLGFNTLPSNPGSPPPRPKRRNLPALDWISMYAIAVNEENAAGGRVVTAPTNGSAGTLPAVLKYYLEFICPNEQQKTHDIVEFLLTAAAIGMLYKRGASISAAEMGCQGEVGVSCSMAAGALTAVMGGTVEQVENAAEIAMEHNLGLTCDPPMGLVVIPCIERNALAAVKAVTASQLALNGDGSHRVTLDQVIATMRQTGIDMQTKYKETSEGGLAVNVPIC